MPDGVPTFEKFSAKKREAYLTKLRKGNHKTAASRSVGVSHALVCLYRQANPEFADLEEQAQMEANGLVENALFQSAVGGNVTACQVWLYNRVPDRWQDKRNVEHGGTVGLDHGGAALEALVVALQKAKQHESPANGTARNGSPGHANLGNGSNARPG